MIRGVAVVLCRTRYVGCRGLSMPTSRIQARRKARIFVVDDHPLVRDGLAVRLAREADMEVCGDADHVEQAVIQIRAERPDLVIVDLSLGQEHGLDLLRQLQTANGQVKMLVLSAYDEAVYAERALRAGAMGYVNKAASWDVVVEAIRTVLQGKRYLSPDMAGLLLERALGAKQAPPSSLVDALTDRELEVFRADRSGTLDRGHRPPVVPQHAHDRLPPGEHQEQVEAQEWQRIDAFGHPVGPGEPLTRRTGFTPQGGPGPATWRVWPPGCRREPQRDQLCNHRGVVS